MAGSKLLELDGLGIRFGGLAAVKGLTMSVEEGSVTSVIGPNGAGKSTLFNLVSGALRPGSGRVLFGGSDVTGMPPEKLLRAGLARSFQITNLFFQLPVHENLRLACQAWEPTRRALLPLGRSRRAAAQVDKLLERFELQHRAGELAGNLSHGEQRRLEIAVTLAHDPRLLLLDEPTQGMSHGDTADTARLIRELARDTTILLIEHDIDLVMALSDRVVVMHLGEKLADDVPEAVSRDPAVRKAYLGEA